MDEYKIVKETYRCYTALQTTFLQFCEIFPRFVISHWHPNLLWWFDWR